MDGLTLEQAARESGRSARELRLTIESGDLPAFQRAGRWLVDPADLQKLFTPESTDQPEPPRLTEVPPPAPVGDEPEQHPLDELLARLETRAVEVATLREQLGARRNADTDKVERLERDLADTRMELEQARRSLEALEGGDGDGRPSTRPQGMRDALTPLFERTRAPGESGSGG